MISIIVPVYNVEHCLPICLDSLLNQTYYNLEVVCVNDGSLDKSGYILEDYSKRDHRLKVITQENKGIASARNRAIEEAQGEWIMFVDSDDWIDKTTCERAMTLITDSDIDVVLWAYTREFANGKKAPRFLMDRDKLFDEKNIQSLHRLIIGPIGAELCDPTLLHSWGTVWGKLYSRNVISETKFVDTKIIGSAEDILFNIEIFTRVKRAFYINEAMYHYRKSGKSFTGGHNNKLNERWIILYSMISDIIEKYNLTPDFNKALNSRIALGLIGQGLNECRSPQNIRSKTKAIKQIISQKEYCLAVKDFPLKYFPIHWQLFFWAAKNGRANILYILLLMMNR